MRSFPNSIGVPADDDPELAVEACVCLQSPRSTILKFRHCLVVVSAALLHGLPAQAHHSFAAEFDGNKPVRLVGSITKIEWTNPHSYFYLDVKESSGAVHNWAVESGNPGALSTPRLGEG